MYKQNEATLKTWVDPHCLKKIYNTWYKDGRRVVTNDLEHWWSLIQSHHNPLVYGHLGINWTIRLFGWYYWWPVLHKEVTDYVRGCAECQWHKVNNQPTRAALSPIYPTPEALPFETIALDFIAKLPMSQGFDSILSITAMTVLRCRTSSLVEKRLTQKKLQPYTLSTYSLLMDSPPTLLVIGILVLPDGLWESCAIS